MKLMPPKQLGPRCNGELYSKRNKKCSLFSDGKRQEILQDFYSMRSLQLQREYIARYIKLEEIKQKTKQKESGHADLKTEINSLKTSIEGKISHLVDDIKDLRKENTECKQRIVESERKLKKFNLIVYGVQGIETDTTDELLKVIGDYLHYM
ncbi:unnamed protein product [Psylliodes chrysocephalus]|uniref:Uncharacterized protein n=1 Tax=Psylliodes chrysocephalus TaxID=3402493 RepID=A0A9P0CN03_9CUCU|nr:unnamed protein product [Psylliodes chrysocephala]